MKSAAIVLLGLLLGAAQGARAQDTVRNYGNELSKTLTKYYVTVFWKGPSWRTGTEGLLEKRAAESKDLHNLVKAGKLVGIVKTYSDPSCKLLAFFKTDTKEEVQAIAESMLIVKEKVVTPEYVEVWGTRGMGKAMREQMGDRTKRASNRTYYIGFFKKGDNWSANAPDDSIRAWAQGHAQRALEMMGTGELKFYGAIEGNNPLRVIGIYAADNLDAAKQRLAEAPSVKNGWFTAETYACSILDGVLP